MPAGGSGVADIASIVTRTWIRLTHSSSGCLLTYARQAFFAASIWLTLVGSAAGAASQSCSAESPPPIVANQPNYRQVMVSAKMANNQLILTLTAADLSLYQGTKHIPVVFFQQVPVTVGILVDTSGSMVDKLAISRNVIRSFVKDLNPCDDLFLLAFSDRAFPLSQLTTDRAELIRNLSFFHAYGKSAVYDTINTGLGMLSKGSHTAKALFLVTDGIDSSSSNRLDAVSIRASKANVPIYSIGIGTFRINSQGWNNAFSRPFLMTMDSEAVDTNVLSTLAKDTGGETFLATLAAKDESLELAAAAIADRINNHYTVGFVGDGSTNQLRLQSLKHKELKFKIVTPD
jgi:VWFA-related protein